MFGNEFGKACNDAKWVEIKGIDARTRGELEVRCNALTLLNV